jgi:hypothetical protein
MKYSGRMAALAATMALAVSPEAWGGNTSLPAYVSLDAESTAIWRTAFSSTVTLKWKIPPTATKATLTVSSATRVASMADLTVESYVLQLPPATSAKDENVYTLVLDFDNGHSVTGQVGVVTSAAAGASATIRGVILYEFAERVWLCVSAPVSACGTVVPVSRNSTS